MKLINADYLTGRIFTEASLKDAHTCYESIMAIIKSMESEDVLDKIRTEISNLDNLNVNYLSTGIYTVDKQKVLQIIDRHMERE